MGRCWKEAIMLPIIVLASTNDHSIRPLMRPRTTLLGVTFASSLHSFGMQTSEFRPRGAGALGGIKGRLGLSLEVGHDVAGDQLEALGGRRRGCPIMAAHQIGTQAAV